MNTHDLHKTLDHLRISAMMVLAHRVHKLDGYRPIELRSPYCQQDVDNLAAEDELLAMEKISGLGSEIRPKFHCQQDRLDYYARRTAMAWLHMAKTKYPECTPIPIERLLP